MNFLGIPVHCWMGTICLLLVNLIILSVCEIGFGLWKCFTQLFDFLDQLEQQFEQSESTHQSIESVEACARLNTRIENLAAKMIMLEAACAHTNLQSSGEPKLKNTQHLKNIKLSAGQNMDSRWVLDIAAESESESESSESESESEFESESESKFKIELEGESESESELESESNLKIRRAYDELSTFRHSANTSMSESNHQESDKQIDKLPGATANINATVKAANAHAATVHVQNNDELNLEPKSVSAESESTSLNAQLNSVLPIQSMSRTNLRKLKKNVLANYASNRLNIENADTYKKDELVDAILLNSRARTNF